MATGSLYSGTDKTLFDALNQHQITNQQLRELFLSRGIIVSKDTPRKTLARIFSRFLHDYEDHQVLASILGVSSRREKTTSILIASNLIKMDHFENAAHSLKDSLSDEGEVVRVHKHEKSLQINIKYTDYDFNKSDYKQVIERELTIIIEDDGDKEFTIRGPLNDKGSKVTDFIIEAIETELNTQLPRTEISLNHVTEASQRTKFFTSLIENMDGFELVDVTDVYIFHPKIRNDVDDDEEEKDDSASPITQIVHISKASLKGVGVLQSEELQGLSKRGFYIWKIIWTAKNNSYDSDHYVFEAQFSNAEQCSQFSYLARGFFKYLGSGEFSASKIQHSEFEEQILNKVLEEAALKTIDEL